MNRASISGKIKEVEFLDDGHVFAKVLNKDTDSIFYVYWDSNTYTQEEIEGKFVSISGHLQYINVKDKTIIKRILAIKSKELIPYDF